jgi:hypothetical protein
MGGPNSVRAINHRAHAVGSSIHHTEIREGIPGWVHGSAPTPPRGREPRSGADLHNNAKV